MGKKKSAKSSQSKKGKVGGSKDELGQLKPHNVEAEEIVSSDEVKERTRTDEKLEAIEVKIVAPDQKNNNSTKDKCGDSLEASAPTSSPAKDLERDRREEEEDSSKPGPDELKDSASVNFNNNVCESMEKDVKESKVSVTPPLSLKHPLEHTWTLWWFNNKTKNWKAEEVISFSTIEDFWGAYNWVQPASKLGINSDYAVFKKGIQPDWEDPNNAKGGRWVTERTNLRDMDACWLETLFTLVGEHVQPYSNLINGAVVQKKKGKFRVDVWLKDSSEWSEMGIRFIGRHLKLKLRVSNSDVMYFRVHAPEQKRPLGRSLGKFSPNDSTLFAI